MTFALPLDTPPMEARLEKDIPREAGWQYEPKWDGFRCLAFRDGDDVRLQSKSGQPLERYFPEVVARLRALPIARFVLDGELVIERDDALSFDVLLQRIHPAASRVALLARETPASYLVFDLLADDDAGNTLELPLHERRARLERFAARAFPVDAPERIGSGLSLSPATHELAIVDAWFARVGGALDGIVAKRIDAPYRSGERDAAVKIKHIRSADCVVGGYRLAGSGTSFGSLLLGLHDSDRRLHYVGHTSGFDAQRKQELFGRLRAAHADVSFTGRTPGGPSRWNRAKSTLWQPIRPEIVIEVTYDQVTGDRFRHGTRPVRLRPDKTPEACKLAQIRGDDRTIVLVREASP